MGRTVIIPMETDSIAAERKYYTLGFVCLITHGAASTANLQPIVTPTYSPFAARVVQILRERLHCARPSFKYRKSHELRKRFLAENGTLCCLTGRSIARR